MSKYDYSQSHFAYDGHEKVSRPLLAAWRQHLLDQYHLGFNLFLTLNYNRPRSIDTVLSDARHLFARLNRQTLGPRWSSDERRWQGYAVVEHPDSNIHLHALVQPALACQGWSVEHMAAAIRLNWRSIAPAGTVDLQPVIKKPKTVISYMLKERGRGALTGLSLI